MAHKGYLFRKGKSWFLRYDVNADGQDRKQKCVKLADYCDSYRVKRDLRDLVKQKFDDIEAAQEVAKEYPDSLKRFDDYVEKVYLPFVQRNMKPSTHAAYSAYCDRYIKPDVGSLALGDFKKKVVSSLLKKI